MLVRMCSEEDYTCAVIHHGHRLSFLTTFVLSLAASQTSLFCSDCSTVANLDAKSSEHNGCQSRARRKSEILKNSATTQTRLKVYMAVRPTKQPKKRKGPSEDHVPSVSDRAHDFPDDVGLDMHSEDEADGNVDEDDGEDDGVEDFPELDPDSDSEDDDSEEFVDEGGSEDEQDEDSEQDQWDEVDDGTEVDEELDIKLFPDAKIIKSKITGRPKKVYPEIIPDYDSDSSTEDVRIIDCVYMFKEVLTSFLHFRLDIRTDRILIEWGMCQCTGTMTSRTSGTT